MSDPTSRRTPTRFPSARVLRARADLPPTQGFPWFEANLPRIVDGEVLAQQQIPSQRNTCPEPLGDGAEPPESPPL